MRLFQKFFSLVTFASLLVTAAPVVHAQDTKSADPLATRKDPAPQSQSGFPQIERESTEITVPAGTRLPLVLRNSITTRNARVGESVYFQTAYPIGVGTRMAIPIGTFARGMIVEAKRPGRIRGRGRLRILLDQLTFPSGYTVSLLATTNSVEHDGREQTSANGEITGPGGLGKDAATIGMATLAGGPAGGYAGLLAGSANARNLAIGHAAGAVVGLAIVMLTRGPDAELPRGTMVDMIFDKPLQLDTKYIREPNEAGAEPQFQSPVQTEQESPQHRRERRRMAGARRLHSPFLGLILNSGIE